MSESAPPLESEPAFPGHCELQVIGLSHLETPIQLRERLATPEGQLAEVLHALRGELGVAEAVLVSTCNRVELYLAPGSGSRCREVAGFFERQRQLSPGALARHLYEHQGELAVRHLFRVACGLDSMVLGETQVLGQLKTAYRAADDGGFLGRETHRAFQAAFRVAKAVHSSSSLGRTRVSVASVAAELAGRLFHDLGTKTVLVVGAGEVAEDILAHLRAAGVSRILVCNRTHERAAELAASCGGTAFPFVELPQRLAEADLLVTSVAVAAPILDQAQLASACRERRGRSLLALDLGVPRNIDPRAEKLENLFLYNIDHLQLQVAENVESRRASISAAQAVIDEHLTELAAARDTRALGRLVAAWQASLESIVEEEVRSHLSRLGRSPEEDLEVLRRLARRLQARWSHPLLKELSSSPAAALHAEWLARAYGLSEEATATQAPGAGSTDGG